MTCGIAFRCCNFNDRERGKEICDTNRSSNLKVSETGNFVTRDVIVERNEFCELLAESKQKKPQIKEKLSAHAFSSIW